ncbi:MULTISPECIES: IclR family transcriptional regulator [Alphaproteobacteria]|uniref:IclR family transcriptional regulator n=2 Tax=Alphaproteobacteria TaxID=28211 RepID=A0A512HNK2_9HYPH|nr:MULTISPECIES: IclR family transcriptional regulator [Alphaproteobacteria]GEO87024.1 IclR family transcriptional regulator [Ciceribacter naphthalenivorans]GLR21600.1 IclR family transcriptional regulator [Ciceribacter naphthalenivorans]GLT04456.1 IclR family transcriptional regulator [Sphingomonas psychrolutea]
MVNPIDVAEDDKERAPRSQTLVRGLEILDAVANQPRTIAEIATMTGLTYSTVHRIVSVLLERRYLKAENPREFALGARLIELGFAAYSRTDLVRVSRARLEGLARETRDTIHLAQLDGGEVSYLDKLRGTRPVEISSRIGGRKPVISTGVGKALILDEPESALLRLYQRDHHLLPGNMSEADWLAQMAAYRAGGYAFDLGEDEPSIRCVAAPLRDAMGRIVGAISVSSTVEYMAPERMRDLVPEVQRVAREISSDLGARV